VSKEIYKKLFKIHKRIKNPEKGTQGYGYLYSNLEQILEVINPEIEKENILLLQFPIRDNDYIGVKTKLVDLDSEQEIEFVFSTLPPKPDCQASGSLITYFRKFSLLSIFRLSPVDKDGAETLINSKSANVGSL